jgi:hypothetical protein
MFDTVTGRRCRRLTGADNTATGLGGVGSAFLHLDEKRIGLGLGIRRDGWSAAMEAPALVSRAANDGC